MTEIACAFTGHRNVKSDFDYDKFKSEVINLIEEENVTVFYDGVARGFDLIAAKCVIELKEKYAVKLIACIPCKGQEKCYSPEEKEDYNYVLKNSDEIKILSQNYYSGCMYARNRYIVNNADIVLAYLTEHRGGTWYTVNYAVSSAKRLILL